MKNVFKRFLNVLLVLVMLIGMIPSAAYAEVTEFTAAEFAEEAEFTIDEIQRSEFAGADAPEEDNLCEHHPVHEGCSYREAVEASPCTHEHGDECYAISIACCHVHGEGCDYVAGLEGTPCTHTHDETCAFVESVAEVPCNCEVQIIHADSCAFVESAEVPCNCEAQIIHADSCVYAPAVEGSPCLHCHDEACGYSEGTLAQGNCNHACTEESGCVVKILACTHTHDEVCGYKEAAEAVACDFECKECSDEGGFESITMTLDEEFPNDELYDAYIENLFYDNAVSTYGILAGNRLQGGSRQIYNELKADIADVAAGRRSSTTFYTDVTLSFACSSQSEGRDAFDQELDRIVTALFHDCPYDLYWATNGWGCSWYYDYANGVYSADIAELYIEVAGNYRVSSGDKVTFNTSYVSTAVAASQYAKNIVSQYSSYNDYQKLLAYKNKICNLVEYDDDALDKHNKDPYYPSTDIRSWQLINVFDNNSQTNVVCEGYAEAFQYLCDLSSFAGNVNCYTVKGDAGGGHEWNIVNYGGISYHVDVTWCDGGWPMFMVGGSGSITGGYNIKGDFYYYDYDVIALWGSGSSSILKLSSTDLAYNAPNIVAPTVSIANRSSDGKPSLSWNNVGASSYEVYRSTGNTSSYSRLITTSNTSYVDTGTTVGTTYYYKVKAIYANGSSATSGGKSIVCGLSSPTVTVSNNASTGKPKLSWTAVSGAVRYEVYGRSSKSDTYTKLYNTVNTSYTHSSAVAGETYYYKVRAVYSNTAANSAFSAAKSIVCDLACPTVTVSNNASTGKPKLSWTAVSGAVRYEVYGRSSKSDTYTKLYNTVNTSYTHSSAVAGETYYYKVRAVYSNTAANSAFSAGKGVVCDLACPTVTVSNNASTGKPKLSWTAVSGAVRYEVYGRSSKSDTYTKLYNTVNTSYTHSSAVAGETYYYKVRAVYSNTAANSAFSAGKGVVCDLACPTVTVSNNASTGKPKLSWTAVSGAVRYEVYGRSSKSDTYTKLYNTVNTSYTHSSAVAGETYYYKVRAVYSNTAANSAFSAGKGVVCDLACPTVTVSNNASTGKPKLSWTAVSGAVRYEVYGRSSESDTYTKLYNTVNTSYIHSSAVAGETYYYKVRAVYSDTAANSAFSATKSIISK